MFEIPEMTIIARQMMATITGKTIRQGRLGNSPHKFVWYNRTPDEFTALTAGKKVGNARVRGRWLSLDLEPGYRLILGECGGKILFNTPGAILPEKYHLLISFDDDSALSVMTSMWGAMELYEAGQESGRQYIKNMRPTPVEDSFTDTYFNNLIDGLVLEKKRSVKSLLTQDQLIPGLGNAIAQDILFHARLNPRHPLNDLSAPQRLALYSSIKMTVTKVIEQGGRYDEFDLFGQTGGYKRLMDSHTSGKPCPECGHTVEKSQYLGGTCVFCPNCQE